MIVVDSSAVCAVFFHEPERDAFSLAIDGEDRCLISAVNAHETATVLRGKLGREAASAFWRWLQENSVEIAPFDEFQARAAADAFDRYGKGIDPNARLNLADCAAYALAKTMNAQLLFKGDDFVHTDIGRR